MKGGVGSLPSFPLPAEVLIFYQWGVLAARDSHILFREIFLLMGIALSCQEKSWEIIFLSLLSWEVMILSLLPITNDGAQKSNLCAWGGLSCSLSAL